MAPGQKRDLQGMAVTGKKFENFLQFFMEINFQILGRRSGGVCVWGGVN